MLMTSPAPAERRNNWRGGVVLQCLRFGPGGIFAEIWTLDPRDKSERVITVHAEGELPAVGDDVAWNYDHSPAWWPKGATERRCFLPRIGRSFDPSKKTARTAYPISEKAPHR